MKPPKTLQGFGVRTAKGAKPQRWRSECIQRPIKTKPSPPKKTSPFMN